MGNIAVLSIERTSKFLAKSQQFDEPVLLSGVIQDWVAFLEKQKGDAPDNDQKTNLKIFVCDVVLEAIKAVDIKFLNEIAYEIKRNTLTESRLKKLEIPSNDPTPDQLSALFFEIHSQVNELQVRREEISHYVSVLKHAQNYLTGIRKVLTQFICDSENSPQAFNHLSERQRFAEMFVIDLDTISNTLKINSIDLAGILSTNIQPQQYQAFRLDSALRLIVQNKGLELKMPPPPNNTSPLKKDSNEEEAFSTEEV